MTTTAAGDAAVARLNKATEAFEKIITGASNQVVDVPGYGNQPTLAARVDQRLDETTATATAEANRSRDEADRATSQATAAADSVTQAASEFNKAKTQADRAQSEADRAAQITGLSTVADAIGMAALPLPDVWAPLTDSLRLFTGYGREVKVGTDVVARMVNFSRNSTATYIDKDGLLKTAVANEPRFEKGGLLIEGQSTDKVPNSNMRPDILELGAYTITGVTKNGFALHRCEYVTGNNTLVANLNAAGATASFVIDTSDISGVFAAYFNGTDGYVRFWPKEDSVFKYDDLGGGLVRVSRLLRDQATSNILHVRCSSQPGSLITLGCFQVEELPFATSYIPTSGAAVTRAADLVGVPQSLNLGESQLGFSLAVEFDTVNTGPHRILELSDFSSIIADGASLTIRHAGKEVYGINAPLGRRHHIAYSVAADGVITVALNGKVLAPQSRSGGAASSKASIILGNRWSVANDMAIYGHLRDLKIWTKKPLTAEQLKVASA
ncbi:hypothetical protein ACET94_00640 [Aeromonas veronii]